MAYSRTNAPAQRNDNRPATQGSNIPELKNMLGSESVKARFEEVLGKKAAQFTASIVNVVTVRCRRNETVAEEAANVPVGGAHERKNSRRILSEL